MVDAKQQEINIGTLARGRKLSSQPYFFRCWSKGGHIQKVTHPQVLYMPVIGAARCPAKIHLLQVKSP